MTTDNAATPAFDASDMDVAGGDNVGGPRHPFLSMGPEGGSGCNYTLEQVASRWWRKPITNGKKGVKGPQRFNFTARVLASEGEGATLPGTLVGLLFAEPESGHEFYLRDAKACVKAFTGKALDDTTEHPDFAGRSPIVTKASVLANELFDGKQNTYVGARCGVQVTHNAKNPAFPVYTFEGPLTNEPEAKDGAEQDEESDIPY